MEGRPHTAKYARKRLEVHGSEATVTFSPAVLEALQNLHALAVAHGPEKFDDDAAHILKDMAHGKPWLMDQALSALATVCAEAGQCYAKTDDWNMHEALNGVRLALNGADPVTLTIEPKAKGRET